MDKAVVRRMRTCVLAGLTLLPMAVSAQTDVCQAVNYSCEAQTSEVVARGGRATVLLRFPGADQCTGTVVNNGRNDGRPFILTARHCAVAGDLDQLAGSVSIVYGHELPCDGSPGLPSVATTGALHRATYQDAWLIEALDAPPPAADVYFAGLNATGTPGARHFGVHHGNGRPKQFVEQQVASGNIQYLISGLLGLVVSTWHTNPTRGSTPYGSSGSALFDEQARVFGTLSTGVICPGNLIGNDYQQLAAAWRGGGTEQTALRPWLDPDGAGFTQLAGRWPDQAPSPPGPGPDAGPGAGSGGGGGALSLPWFLCGAVGFRRLLRRACRKKSSTM